MIDRHHHLSAPREQLLDRLIATSGVLLVASGLSFGAYEPSERTREDASASPLARAITAVEQAVREEPETLAHRLGLAGLYYTSSRFTESAEQYRAALSIDDRNVVAMWGLGRALDGAGRSEEAARTFEQVATLAEAAL